MPKNIDIIGSTKLILYKTRNPRKETTTPCLMPTCHENREPNT